MRVLFLTALVFLTPWLAEAQSVGRARVFDDRDPGVRPAADIRRATAGWVGGNALEIEVLAEGLMEPGERVEYWIAVAAEPATGSGIEAPPRLAGVLRPGEADLVAGAVADLSPPECGASPIDVALFPPRSGDGDALPPPTAVYETLCTAFSAFNPRIQQYQEVRSPTAQRLSMTLFPGPALAEANELVVQIFTFDLGAPEAAAPSDSVGGLRLKRS